MKVAVIEPVGGHGGMNYYDFGLCSGLAKIGVEVTLYTCDETMVPNNLSFNVKLYFKKIYGNAPKLLRAGRYLLGLLRSLENARLSNITLVHFHFFHATLLECLSVKLAKLYGFKIVITAHDVDSFVGNSRQWIDETLYHTSDLVIAHNQVSCKELIERLHVSQKKIRVIPHGNYIDFVGNRITKQQSRERLAFYGTGFFILFFGQIKEVKGLDILLHALPDVIKKFPSTQLVIAGKVWKDNFSQYQALIEKYKLDNHVISHIRYIPDELVSYYYHSADVVVLPYRKIYQSGALLMAMSFACPVLVADLEGMTEVIQDNINGFVFKQGDSDHLAQRLNEVLSEPQKMMQVAEAGYATVFSCHSWIHIGQETIHHAYSELEFIF